MWQLDNRTPFAAERGWVRGRDGAEIWLVAVKATFDIGAGGSTTVSKEQPPVLRLPEHHGEPGKSSVKYDADLVLTKKTTDIIVVGHAHAPAGTAVEHLDAGFRVGPVHKLVRVFGDRRWSAFGRTAPRPFQRMPLVWERAYGGAEAASKAPGMDRDWRNPVGVGHSASSNPAQGSSLPNIENPMQLIRTRGDKPPPAGLGAIASHWQPRVAYAGTYDAQWEATRAPLLAADMDERWYQCAPPDQQPPAFLRGGEDVLLHNLNPLGSLRFKLPRIHLGYETRFHDGTREIHRDRRLHTVILEPDFPRVSVVWHTALPCHFRVHQLDRTTITLKADVGSGPAASHDIALELA